MQLVREMAQRPAAPTTEIDRRLESQRGELRHVAYDRVNLPNRTGIVEIDQLGPLALPSCVKGLQFVAHTRTRCLLGRAIIEMYPPSLRRLDRQLRAARNVDQALL